MSTDGYGAAAVELTPEPAAPGSHSTPANPQRHQTDLRVVVDNPPTHRQRVLAHPIPEAIAELIFSEVQDTLYRDGKASYASALNPAILKAIGWEGARKQSKRELQEYIDQTVKTVLDAVYRAANRHTTAELEEAEMILTAKNMSR